MQNLETKIWGSRGSRPAIGKQFEIYGGNTCSVSVRTPENTLIFFDAGTGVANATSELLNAPESIIFALSHAHPDHIQGLPFGLDDQPGLWDIDLTDNQSLAIYASEETFTGLQNYYDGDLLWPSSLHKSSLYQNSSHHILKGKEVISIDSSTDIHILQGNHPVDGSLIYRVDSSHDSLVYATDVEWGSLCNFDGSLEQFQHSFKGFISDSTHLIMDAKYLRSEYSNKLGDGHSCAEDVVDLAAVCNINRLTLFHHGHHSDDELLRREKYILSYARQVKSDLYVEFARDTVLNDKCV